MARQKSNGISREWLSEKFSNIEDKLDEHRKLINEHIEQDRRDFALVSQKLDVTNLHVDRLEQKDIQREHADKWRLNFATTLFVSVLSIILGFVGSWLF